MENTPRILAKRGLPAPKYVEMCELRSCGRRGHPYSESVNESGQKIGHAFPETPQLKVVEIVGFKSSWPHSSVSPRLVRWPVITEKSHSLFPDTNTMNYGMSGRSCLRAL